MRKAPFFLSEAKNNLCTSGRICVILWRMKRLFASLAVIPIIGCAAQSEPPATVFDRCADHGTFFGVKRIIGIFQRISRE